MNRTHAHYELELLIHRGGMGEVWLARDTRPAEPAAGETTPAEPAVGETTPIEPAAGETTPAEPSVGEIEGLTNVVPEFPGTGTASEIPNRSQSLKFSRFAALKIPKIEFDAEVESVMRRFGREADVVRRLEHPNVARYLESRTDGDQPYLAMEYVEGSNLHELEQRARAEGVELPLDWASRLGRPLAEALRYLHRDVGVIHRDIKPENLIVTENGRVVIIDFGIAIQPDQTRLTRPTDRIGSERFMAPEQRQSPSEAYFATDVYAFGLVLYEMLTGRLPREGRYAPIRRFRRKFPRHWDALVAKCLKNDPSERYADGGELLEALDRLPEIKSAQVTEFPIAWEPAKGAADSSTAPAAAPEGEADDPAPTIESHVPARLLEKTSGGSGRRAVKRAAALAILTVGLLLGAPAAHRAFEKGAPTQSESGSQMPMEIVAPSAAQTTDPTTAPANRNADRPKTPTPDFRQVVNQVQAGDLVDAANQLSLLVAMNPANEGYRANLALLYLEQNQRESAVYTLKDGLRYRPQSNRLKKLLTIIEK